MTITITSGSPLRRGKTFQSLETLAQSTATAFQLVNLTTDLTALGMGTATGFGLNLYRVTDGYAGLEKAFLATATGEAKLVFDTSTATGMWLFDAADDYMRVVFEGLKWRLIVNSGCTTTPTT